MFMSNLDDSHHVIFIAYNKGGTRHMSPQKNIFLNHHYFFYYYFFNSGWQTDGRNSIDNSLSHTNNTLTTALMPNPLKYATVSRSV